jgi:hypothetical protein
VKDYRRQGLTHEQFQALLKTKFATPSPEINGRMGCSVCPSRSGLFFLYADVCVCFYCLSRWAIKMPAAPSHLSSRIRCRHCRGFLWKIEIKRVSCYHCKQEVPLGKPLEPRPLFDYRAPEVSSKLLNIRTELRRLKEKEQTHAEA